MEDFSNQDTHIYDDEIIIRVLNDILNVTSSFFRTFTFLLKQRQMNRVLWQQYGLSEINGKRIMDVFSRFQRCKKLYCLVPVPRAIIGRARILILQ